MNIAFWLFVIIVLALLWLCLSFAFKGIGAIGLKLFNGAKNEILGTNKNETKENNENEG